MHPRRNTAKVRLIQSTRQLTVDTTLTDDSFPVGPTIADGDWHVLLEKDGERLYPLGMRTVVDGICLRRTQRQDEPGTAMEESAVARLGTVLRRGHEEARLRIIPKSPPTKNTALESKSIPVWGQLKALAKALAAPMFLVDLDLPLHAAPGDTCTCQVELTGVAFRFDTVLLESDGTTTAWKLPREAWRLVRRTAPRRLVGLSVDVTCQKSGATHPSTLVDISPIGCGLTHVGHDLTLWDEICVRFRLPGRPEVVAAAIVTEVRSSDVVGCIFEVGHPRTKDNFFAIHGAGVEGLTFSQKAEDAWECLEKNGYLDLLEGGKLRDVRTSCISAWKKTDRSLEAFQPVASVDGVAIGTIAAAQIAADHWVPHSLATVVDRQFLRVTDALYQSWPLYILAQGTPSWFSTWYDADKQWHNRFYQVFIHEHAQDPECFSFVRRWFWSPDLSISGAPNQEFEIRPLDRSRDIHLLKSWNERYGNRDIPVVRLDEGEHFAFESWPRAVLWNHRPVAIIACMTSSLELNPIGALNIAHINVFDIQLKRNSSTLICLIRAVAHSLKDYGLSKASLTLDYDCDIGPGEIDCLEFGAARCLTASSAKLADLISNNALCFADMIARHK